MSKVEITIPPQFSDAVEKTAKKEGITADELMERALRKFLERSKDDVRN
ncbi:ribbon-helix-helix protein, CopG family [Ruminococcus sp.]|nr:ribbon-helix-helix protein, CopG family [Ruminococcus sp.]